jgi:PIN domain nuclease of toxin-antitoxin system
MTHSLRIGSPGTLDLHGDPADRIIAATAIIHRAKLVTSDKLLRRDRAVPTLW